MPELLKKEMPVDKKLEKLPRQTEMSGERAPVKIAGKPAAPVAPQAISAAPEAPVAHDGELIMIESILSEDIYSIYSELSEAKKKEFQKKGVETAIQIKKMLRQAKIKVHDLLELIKNWLLLLPGINKFFLEQEAKIKTDKVLELKRSGQKVER